MAHSLLVEGIVAGATTTISGPCGITVSTVSSPVGTMSINAIGIVSIFCGVSAGLPAAARADGLVAWGSGHPQPRGKPPCGMAHRSWRWLAPDVSPFVGCTLIP